MTHGTKYAADVSASINSLLPQIGDFKHSLFPTDHRGWVNLDGRAVNTLAPAQQLAFGTISSAVNLPNGDGVYLSQVPSQPLGTLISSNELTLSQANLPDISLTAQAISAGIPTGSVTVTAASAGTPAGAVNITGASAGLPTGSVTVIGASAGTPAGAVNITGASAGTPAGNVSVTAFSAGTPTGALNNHQHNHGKGGGAIANGAFGLVQKSAGGVNTFATGDVSVGEPNLVQPPREITLSVDIHNHVFSGQLLPVHTHAADFTGAALAGHVHSAEFGGNALTPHTHAADFTGAALTDHNHVASFTASLMGPHGHACSFTGAALADHTHNVPLGGSATPIDKRPLTFVTKLYMYLG